MNFDKEDFINLTAEYCDSNSKNYYVDAFELFDYLENNGFSIIRKRKFEND